MNLPKVGSLVCMLENLQSVTLLTLAEIVGPIVLGAGLWFGIMRTRRLSRSERQVTDWATKRRYRQESNREQPDL
jgi:hypothetical protein